MMRLMAASESSDVLCLVMGESGDGVAVIVGRGVTADVCFLLAVLVSGYPAQAVKQTSTHATSPQRRCKRRRMVSVPFGSIMICLYCCDEHGPFTHTKSGRITKQFINLLELLFARLAVAAPGNQCAVGIITDGQVVEAFVDARM